MLGKWPDAIADTDAEEALGTVFDLVGAADTGQLMPSVLRRACETSAASCVLLLRVDGDDVRVEGAHDVDRYPVTRGWNGAIDRLPMLMAALETGRPTLLESTSAPAPPPELREELRDVRHTMILPLLARGRPAGFIVLLRRHPPPFVETDARMLALLGTVALVALRRSRAQGDTQAAARALSSSLNLIVHDLRAPLTVLSGYVDLLRDGTFGEAPASWQRPMDLIAEKVGETHRLVDDILLDARIEAGPVRAVSQRLDLNEVIERAATRSQAQAALAGARIEVASHTRPVSVDADAFHVDRIVDNLINNAINYGGRSPWVRLSIDASARSAIRVEDHGVGVSPELHGRIFDRFFRVDSHVPGTGFGLHVARVLAEACGGSLRIERSAPGEGSVFRLELPAAPAAA